MNTRSMLLIICVFCWLNKLSSQDVIFKISLKKSSLCNSTIEDENTVFIGINARGCWNLKAIFFGQKHPWVLNWVIFRGWFFAFQQNRKQKWNSCFICTIHFSKCYKKCKTIWNVVTEYSWTHIIRTPVIRKIF